MLAMIPDVDTLHAAGRVLAVAFLLGVVIALGLFGMALAWTKDGGRHRG